MILVPGVELATPLDIVNCTDNTVSPIVITSTAHGLFVGDMVFISGILVNTSANGSFFVSAKDANTFTLTDLGGGATTGSGDYAEGAPTGDVTHLMFGDLVSRRKVAQNDIGAMGTNGLAVLAAGDKVAMWVANLDDNANASIYLISLDVERQ